MLTEAEERNSFNSVLGRILECKIFSRNRRHRSHEISSTHSNIMHEMEPLHDSNMEFLGILGKGSSGRVSQYRIIKDKSLVAVKQISIASISNAVPGFIIREVSFLKQFNHPNIVRLLNVSSNKNTRLVSLVFECLDCDLHRYIQQNEHYGSSISNPFTRKSFLYQILSAVEYCHSHNIIHRDLKPSNLLIDHKKNIIKLADFGWARELGDPEMYYTKKIATRWYRAPEVLFHSGQYSTPMDIWAVGCIFGEMVLGQPIHNLFYGIEELELIFRLFGTPTEETWPGVTKLCPKLQTFTKSDPMDLSTIFDALDLNGLNLLKRMLYLDPNKRISAEAALKHPYFNDLDQSANKKIAMEGGGNNNNPEEFAVMREGGSGTTNNNNVQEFPMTMEGERSTTMNNNEEEFAVGCLLSIRTVFGEEFEGRVYTFDRPFNMLALIERSKDDPFQKIRMLNANYIEHFTILAQCEDPLDLNVLHAREELAIRQAEADAERIGVGVTSVAQNIFDALSKTLPVRWDKTVIVVMNEVRISSPYNSECVIGGTPEANNRVKKVLKMLRKRLQLSGSDDVC